MGRPAALALAAATLLAAAMGFLGAAARPSGRFSKVPGDPIYRLTGEGWTYRFHATFRVEALFEEGDRREARDLSRERPDEVARLRARFLARMDLGSLGAVPAEDEEMRERLRANGYVGGPR